MEGEAYFDVAQDESHPFVVQTHLGEVMVLGTAFNVNAYTNARVCYTTLVRGKVQFSAPNVGTVTLQPGEQAIVSANGTEKRTVDLDEYIGWVNGVYNFKNSFFRGGLWRRSNAGMIYKFIMKHRICVT